MRSEGHRKINEDAAGLEEDAIARVARESNKAKETVRVTKKLGGLLEQRNGSLSSVIPGIVSAQWIVPIIQNSDVVGE